MNLHKSLSASVDKKSAYYKEMAFFNASTSASLTSEGGLIEEDLNAYESSSTRKSRGTNILQRTLSTPVSSSSSYRPSRSATCPSRSNWVSRDSNFSLRSLRSISSPSRMSFIPIKNNIKKFASLVETTSRSVDFKCKFQQPKLLSCQSINNSHFSDQDLFESNDGIQTSNSNQVSLLQNGANRVGRSISSPEGLHPVNFQQSVSSFPYYSPSSPSRFTYSSSTQTDSRDVSNDRSIVSNNLPSTHSYLPSPTISHSGEFQNSPIDRSAQNIYSPQIQGTSGSLNSSLYSSRTSVRGGFESEPAIASGNDIHSFQTRQASTSYWPGEPSPGISLRLQGGGTEERPRLSQLALAHLTSRDLTSLHIQTPPPSYEKLCNPEALPTYQEAIDGERRGYKRYQDQRMVFTLPAVADYNSSHTDPLLQETERSFSGGILSSLAGDLSDSEGGYTTILDAIPSHPLRDSCPAVPIRFASIWSLSHYSSPLRQILCLPSVCNKNLVRRELNRRWPFIVGAREDERSLGLLLVECSSNLTVAQLTDGPPSAGLNEGGATSSQDAIEPSIEGRTQNENQGEDLESAAALNSHVMFYLCGKCVAYDSFDAYSVRAHIEYDCSGPANKWANMSELYLVMRAFCFVLVIILVLMCLPLGRW